MIFKNITIFFRNVILFSYPTDNSRRYPTEESKGSKPFICCRDKRMIRIMR